ncbi:MAG: tetratricopeptide repeat protein [Acidobacteriota bacterium]|nr:tetratricopeptide repeat protein [Acidobacteriota bacterium]
MHTRILLTIFPVTLFVAGYSFPLGGPPSPQTPTTTNVSIELPDGEGKEQVTSLCTTCHDLERVVNQIKSPEAWKVTVSDMLERVSPDMEKEASTIADYLSAHFGVATSDVLTRIISLLDQGDSAASNRLARENVEALREELDEILEDMDRGFDELGRQKARYDVLQDKFIQYEATWMPYEAIFQLFSRVTDHSGYLNHFQAKRLRVTGARHTTSADHFWDLQDYVRALREYDEGTKILRSAIPLAEEVGNQKLVAACLTNIGYNEIYSGNATVGLEVYTQALEIAEQRNDEIFQGMYLLNLGTFHLYTMQSQDALKYALQAAEMNAKIGRRTWEANALLNVGASYLSLQRLEEADSYLQKALLKAQEAKDRRSHGRILYNLALLNSLLDRIPEATTFMEKAVAWYVEYPIVYNEAERTVLQYQGSRYLAGAHRKLDNLEKAQYYADNASKIMGRDPQKLAAYLVDPHINFLKWKDFRKEHGFD